MLPFYAVCLFLIVVSCLFRFGRGGLACALLALGLLVATPPGWVILYLVFGH
jgi:hypothetical protein